MKILQGNVAVIAGASQGIGASVARLFAQQGAHVVLLARNKDNLDLLVQEIESAGGTAICFQMDVSADENWSLLASHLKKNNLQWNILVNCAYWRTLTPLAEVSDSDWDKTISVSLKAYFLGVRAAVPFMLEAGGGSIVNISSLQARIPEKSFGAYAVAKGGVEAMTRVIARDYSPIIRANTLVSGAVDTPGFGEGESAKISLGKRLPMGRIGFPTEIAEAALFLAGPQSSFITGTDLVVDGGRSVT